MAWVALIGPELEENLSLRYIAASLARAGYDSEIVPFNSENDFGAALEAVLAAPEPPLVVGISLAFQWRAQDFLAFAVALRQAQLRRPEMNACCRVSSTLVPEYAKLAQIFAEQYPEARIAALCGEKASLGALETDAAARFEHVDAELHEATESEDE